MVSPVFLTPVAGLVALAALAPLAAALVRERRLRRVRRVLGLARPSGRAVAGPAVAAAAAVALLGLAAAQPAIAVRRTQDVRADAQAYAAIDDSRSMEAVSGRGDPTRLARAKALALRLRDALPDVPWGVASFNDRLLVHVFPTGDRSLFADTLREAVGIDRPPPAMRKRVATSFDALAQAAAGGFFPATARRRLLVLFSDGESTPFAPRAIVGPLRHDHVRLLLIRLWTPHDRVYGRGGRDLGYRPDPRSDAYAAAFRRAGVPVVGADDASAAVAAARRLLGNGPRAAARPERRLVSLAPFVALAAVLPVGFAFVRTRR